METTGKKVTISSATRHTHLVMDPTDGTHNAKKIPMSAVVSKPATPPTAVSDNQ